MKEMNRLQPIICLAAAALLSSALPAQTPSYFPLEVGNSWLYRIKNDRGNSEDRFRAISVQGRETIGGREYFDVEYFGRLVALRSDQDGSIVEYSRESGTEVPWLSLGLPENSTFPTHIDRCADSGTIVSRPANVSTPAGDFSNTVQVKFRGPCADSGPTQQYYAPSIGMVSHEETSFAGPRLFELVYYRAGSSTGGAQELAFTIALDAARYQPGTTVGVRLTLRSTSPDPILLHFPSGKSYDLKIINEQGNSVYVWSASRIFAMIVRDEKFGPGERTYALSAPLGDLPPGRYKVQAYLTTDPIMFVGETTFEVVQ